MDLDRWWRLYDDPQLTELVEQALAHSPDARDAAAKLEQARAVRDAALLSYNPQGAVSASTTREQLGLLESPAAFGKALGGTEIIGGGLIDRRRRGRNSTPWAPARPPKAPSASAGSWTCSDGAAPPESQPTPTCATPCSPRRDPLEPVGRCG